MQNVSSSNSEKALVPKLRFPEFTDEWEENLLSDYSQFLQGLTYKPEDVRENGMLVLRSSNIQNSKLSFCDNVYVDKSIVPYKISTIENDVLMCVRNGSKSLVGKTALITKEHKNLAWGAFMMIIRPKINNTLLYQYLNSPSFKRKIFPDLETATVKQITKGTLNSIKLLLPTDKEQKKISNFLSLIDKKIQLQQQLIENLKLYKRGLISYLFNHKLLIGENCKLAKLGEVFNERAERANGDEELLAVTINNGVQKRSELELKDNSSESKNNYKKVHINDIAYNTMRMWQGASGVSSCDGIVSPAYTVIYLKDNKNNNINFWKYYFKDTYLINKFRKHSQGLTSDTWNLKYNQFSDIKVKLPFIEIQNNISEVLTKFDLVLNYNGKYLHGLNQIKIYLLQQMFI